jgi:hypothetical protein
MHTVLWLENMRERDHLEDPGVESEDNTKTEFMLFVPCIVIRSYNIDQINALRFKLIKLNFSKYLNKIIEIIIFN